MLSHLHIPDPSLCHTGRAAETSVELNHWPTRPGILMFQCVVLKPFIARFILKQCSTHAFTLLEWESPNSFAWYSRSFPGPLPSSIMWLEYNSRLCLGLRATAHPPPSLTATLNFYFVSLLSSFSLLGIPGSFLLALPSLSVFSSSYATSKALHNHSVSKGQCPSRNSNKTYLYHSLDT